MYIIPHTLFRARPLLPKVVFAKAKNTKLIRRFQSSISSSLPEKFTPKGGSNHSSLHGIRSLVCNQCWNDVFNTPLYQRVCLAERDDNNQYFVVTTKTTTTYVKESSSNGCSWCAFIWTFLRHKNEVDALEASYTARLSPVPSETCTPVGNNIFYFSLDPDEKSHGISSALRLSAYTPSVDRAAGWVTARPLETDVSSRKAQEQIVSWLQDCKGHEHCAAQNDVSLPSRVIEVSPEIAPDQPRLVSSNGRMGKYAALSYRWGTPPSYILTTSNIKQHMEGLDLNMLPQTFRDAISVARTIPVDYLWIDALCVLQDSKEDRTIAIAKMEHIYRNSLVTIVAASARDTFSGFLQTRSGSPTVEDTCNIWSGRKIAGSFVIPFRIDDGIFGSMSLQCLGCEIEYDEGREPINTRAWTVQEQLIAERVISYSLHTLQWRCKAGTRNLGDSLHQDRYESPILSKLIKPTHTSREAMLRWLQIIEIYNFREVSEPSDKLPALAGIAIQFAGSLGPNYYAGIWGGFDLIRQLRWSSSSYSRPSSPMGYRAPSWSWAAIDGDICYRNWADEYEPEEENTKPVCELVDISTTLKASTLPYGEVTAGRLILRGKLRQAWLIESKEYGDDDKNQNEDSKKDKVIVWCSEKIDSAAAAEAKHLEWCRRQQELEISDPGGWWTRRYSQPWIQAQPDVFGDSSPRHVTCFALFDDFGLILTDEEKKGTFRRIGSFQNYDTQETDFADSPTEEIVII